MSKRRRKRWHAEEWLILALVVTLVGFALLMATGCGFTMFGRGGVKPGMADAVEEFVGPPKPAGAADNDPPWVTVFFFCVLAAAGACACLMMPVTKPLAPIVGACCVGTGVLLCWWHYFWQIVAAVLGFSLLAAVVFLVWNVVQRLRQEAVADTLTDAIEAEGDVMKMRVKLRIQDVPKVKKTLDKTLKRKNLLGRKTTGETT